jgi:hypothetical protein
VADRFVVPADARVFLGRLTRLDPAAVVRLRPGGADGGGPAARTALWARLPWQVLVTREVAGSAPGDVTVGAAALLAASGELPPRQDPRWRWPLPPGVGQVLEELPGQSLRDIAAAAAGTLREVTAAGLQGRPVGVRMLREALLDHVAIVVDCPSGRIDVPQRLVQAVLQMGFLGSRDAAEQPVRVRRAGRWTGLAARYGTAWLPPPAGLGLRPV